MSDPIDIDDLLARFRHWLARARDEARERPTPAEAGLAAGEPRRVRPDRPGRGVHGPAARAEAADQEHRGASRSRPRRCCPPLRQAIEQFRASPPGRSRRPGPRASRWPRPSPTLDEALDRGRGEIEKARHAILEESGRTSSRPPSSSSSRASRGSAAAGSGGYHEQVVEAVGRVEPGRPAAAVRRAARRLRPDPEPAPPGDAGRADRADRMPGRARGSRADDRRRGRRRPRAPARHVVEELRRGYTWRGRVLRYAEVRASRGGPDAAAGAGRRPSDTR